jgi:hypothetical protein
MVKGVIGQIKWMYHVAADIHGYTVSRSKETKQWSLRATAISVDAYQLEQTPLTFVAPIKNRIWDEATEQWNSVDGEWRWPIESIEVDGSMVVAQLGNPTSG